MTELSALRLYIPMTAKARATRLWHRFSAPHLAQHLLSDARRTGIRQAMLFHVAAGYLPGERPSHYHVEGTAARHPLCVELIDTEESLRKFLAVHHAELHKVHAVLFRCQIPVDIGMDASATKTSERE